MYIYLLEQETFNTPDLNSKDRYEYNKRIVGAFKRTTAMEKLDKRKDRIAKRGDVIVSDEGNCIGDSKTRVIITRDSEESFNTYGYYSYTIFTLTKMVIE